MTARILKLELLSLFLLTIFSFVAFYFGETLPDNFMTISSSAENINYFTYYMISLVAIIGYYTGPWIFFSFATFGLFYTFSFSKRDSWIDTLNIISLNISVVLSSYFFFPSFLGQGAKYILSEYGSTFALVTTLIFSTALFLWGVFRGSFGETCIRCAHIISRIPALIRLIWERINPVTLYRKGKEVKNKVSSNVKTKVPSFLNGSTKEDSNSRPQIAGANREEKKTEEVVEEEEKPSFLQQTVDKISNPINILKRDNSDETNTENNPQGEASKEVREPQRKTVTRRMKATSDGASDNQYFGIVSEITAAKKPKDQANPNDKYFEEIIDLIEEKLSEFKIEGKIINVLKGPVVDTFELELGSGVKVSKVTGATEDLSLALYGAPIRIVYPMKGRTTIGIEVPRNPREIIYLDEVLSRDEFKDSKYQLPVAMGKDAFGEPCIVDLAAMPHMLVAGATGAGKSVFINTLLVSLLVKKSPRQMKLILIDPKQLELALYTKLPHLSMPVITDAKTAAIALLWATQEMDRRYSILKDFGVRNIAGFNEKLKDAGPAMLAKIHHHYEDAGAEDYELPNLVIIVDEFADLILTKAGKEIENNIARLAAKARAAGIHLVLATQRPSVDVITGVIKSNFPTRVSFRVTSATDSRTILDKIGAEKLLGKGDMLYKHGIETMRVHSSYVDENEIEALADKLTNIPQEFHEGAMEFLENDGEVETDEYSYGSHIPSSSDSSGDALYNEAVKVVVEQRAASASMLQRRLKVGYNRAANLIDELEAKGVVGPAQGSKPRKVLAGDIN